MIFNKYSQKSDRVKMLSWFMIAYSFSTGTFLIPICMLILIIGGNCIADKYNYSYL